MSWRLQERNIETGEGRAEGGCFELQERNDVLLKLDLETLTNASGKRLLETRTSRSHLQANFGEKGTGPNWNCWQLCECNVHSILELQRWLALSNKVRNRRDVSRRQRLDGVQKWTIGLLQNPPGWEKAVEVSTQKKVLIRSVEAQAALEKHLLREGHCEARRLWTHFQYHLGSRLHRRDQKW